MKLLTLVRHAKTEHLQVGQKDFDRELTERGHSDSLEMSQRFQKILKPEIWISSNAKRALQTSTIFLNTYNSNDINLELNEKIYESTQKDLLNIINGLNNKYQSAILFGHNPEFTDICNYLSEESIDHLPTCGIVLLKFELPNWSMISRGLGELIYFNYPKNEE